MTYMTSNATLTKEARAHLTDAVSNLRQARELHNATDTRETTWRTKHEAWAARSMVTATRAITLRHETAGTKTSMALRNEITLAFMELVEYAKVNRAVHIIDVLLGNTYTASETLEIIRAGMVSVDETPAPATSAEPSAADYKAAASALAEHGLGEGSIPAPATEEDGDGMSWERDLDDATARDTSSEKSTPKQTGPTFAPSETTPGEWDLKTRNKADQVRDHFATADKAREASRRHANEALAALDAGDITEAARLTDLSGARLSDARHYTEKARALLFNL